jgi:hypothetical protein
MSPLRFLAAIPRLVNIRRISLSDIRVSETWLAEQRAKGFDRRREVPTDLSTLVSERLGLVLAETD